jgi:hypothetical protein
MGNQLDDQILRLYLDVKERSNSILPPFSNQLPFLNLALQTLKERQSDFQSADLSVWKQLNRLMRDLRGSTISSPTSTDVTQLLYILQSLSTLTKTRSDQTKPLLSKKSLILIKELKGIFQTYARKTLTTLLGQYLSLNELLPFVPNLDDEFLDFVPREEIQSRDENGDYHEFLIYEVGEIKFFLHETLYTFQKIFLANIQTLTQYMRKLHTIQSIQALTPELLRLREKQWEKYDI